MFLVFFAIMAFQCQKPASSKSVRISLEKSAFLLKIQGFNTEVFQFSPTLTLQLGNRREETKEGQVDTPVFTIPIESETQLDLKAFLFPLKNKESKILETTFDLDYLASVGSYVETFQILYKGDPFVTLAFRLEMLLDGVPSPFIGKNQASQPVNSSSLPSFSPKIDLVPKPKIYLGQVKTVVTPVSIVGKGFSYKGEDFVPIGERRVIGGEIGGPVVFPKRL